MTKASTAVVAANPQPAPAAAPAGPQGIELPKTGPENMIVGGLGLGAMIVAGGAYLNSRRELVRAFVNR